ncbi:ABC transporter-like protein [Klebsormidium nitens]|uniref:ABC transporter-like protein n=1 Tax=Klebsormidium nitens TaxID=105231 RepID=A0A1Y1I880_KLENI|nr:ABC transporter-like protein [Klebsormidium nitens]|eukprot:GAQ84896.1 ABC transporter-like protein [Klebsormidium nitens]
MLYVVPTRLARNIAVVSTIVTDYLVSLYNVPEGPARERIKHECHERCADRLQKLFFKNGGTYIKLGQHVGQLDYLLPEEYVRIMRESMLDKCPVSTYEQISAVIERELGLPPEQAFAEFAPVPLASASLAQVHKAKTHDGRQVAVKIQHTHLTDTASADTATVAFFVRAVKWAFPDYDYSWLVAELQESLPRELDFVHEGQNAEACARNFKSKSPHLAPYVKIPEIDWSLTSTKVLTMEFMDGVGVTDVAKQKELGIRTADVAHLVSDVFAAMIFHHGFIHCDPHGGNMLVTTADQNGSRRLGKARPQLVLLDHGLYRSLDNNLRSNYAALWKALVLGEETGIRRYSTAIAGEDMYILFASVLTMRPWDQVTNQRLDHLVMPDDPEERLKLQGYAAQFMKETTALLARLPRVVLLLLKTNDCLRSVDLALGTPVNSFVTTARECTRALSQIRYEQNPGIGSLARGAIDKVRVEVRVLLMQTLALYEKVRASMVSWGSLFGNKRTRAGDVVDEAPLALAIPRGLPA